MKFFIYAIPVLFLAGCTTPPNDVAPQATVSPTITAGDIRDIKQDIKQVQKTITTTNYALDARRAKIESEKLRRMQVSDLSGKGVMVGLLLFALIAPSFLSKKYMPVGYLAAIGIIVVSILIPFLWPF